MNKKTEKLIKKFGRVGNPPQNYRKVSQISHGWAWWCNDKSLFDNGFDYGLYKKQ